ncbi:zwei Ig domain protein zig-8-like isoform X2 [Biomphalaria glabrata]|uniref:Zwei Ig domain protein zig-8-like isoform X2 n=2 Tax=Biomphalaria glabrata TaxID=6526 RepID=A0A9W3ANA3_BIOGL|nr:zwei Ig domain protein zig-8-like isoform X2 [Biomphalaria glabrata]
MGRFKWYFCTRHRRRAGPWTRSRLLRFVQRPFNLDSIVCISIIWTIMLPATTGISVLPEFLESYTNVPMEPVFVNTNSNITVREGGRALLPCSIQHLGTKKVSWRFIEEDKYLTIGTMAWSPDDNISVEHVKHSEEHEDWTLVIPKVKKSHAGLYECQLTSVAGYHTNVRLNVVGPPITIPDVTLTGTQFVERGGQIQLQCNATGGMQIAEEIDWFKDGNIIEGSNFKDYVIFTYRSFEQGALVSTLQVDRAGNQHAGTYVCRSSDNKLKDIVVQVLVADSSNVKRGTVSSNHSLSTPIHQSNLPIIIGLMATYWTIIN